MSHDIFISYSRRDTERMQQVRDGLRNAGLSVWTDEGIEPGTVSWKRALSDAITGCTSVVVLFSPEAAQSTWVNRELDFAELHHKKIYPLLVRGEVEESLPFGYTTFQFIDIRSDENITEGIQDLISVLGKTDPEQNLLANAYPQNKTSLASDKQSRKVLGIASGSYHKQEQSWKLLSTSDLLMFIPYSWKISDPTHENVERMFLLHETVEDAENILKQFMEREETMMRELFPLPGSTLIRQHIFTDITDLSVLSGIMYRTKNLLTSRGGAVARLILQFSYSRLHEFMKQFDAHLLEHRQLDMHQGMIHVLSYQRGENLVVSLLNTIPYKLNDTSIIVMLCDKERWDKGKPIFDHMAQSIQLFYS